MSKRWSPCKNQRKGKKNEKDRTHRDTQSQNKNIDCNDMKVLPSLREEAQSILMNNNKKSPL